MASTEDYIKFKKFCSVSFIMASLFMINNKAYGNREDMIYGKDRYETNYNVNIHCNFTDTDTVVFASGEIYPDALSGGNISNGENYPLILIDKKGDNYKKNLRNYPKLKNIIIVGGEKTLSKEVDKNLSKNYNVKRISGSNRYRTSREVYNYLNNKNNKNYKKIGVRGDSFPDALSAVPFARKKDGLVILLDNSNEEFDYIVGGNVKGKSNNIIKGKDRYETSRKLVDYYKEDSLVVVEGSNFPDALSASEIAGKYFINILLIDDKSNKSNDIFRDNSKDVFFVGGKVVNLKKKHLRAGNDNIEKDNTYNETKVDKDIKEPKIEQIQMENKGLFFIDDSNNFTKEELNAKNIREYENTDILLKDIKESLFDKNTDILRVSVKNLEPWTMEENTLVNILIEDNFFRTLYGCIDNQGNNGFDIQYNQFNDKKYLEIFINRDLYPLEKCNRMVKDLKMPRGIIDQLNNIDGEYDKVIYLLDHMAKKNSKYDYVSYNQGIGPNNNPIDAHFGLSQCAGYASYIEYIAKETGIDAEYTTDENIRANHAWVTFNIDGNKYGSDPVVVIKANKGIEKENWLPIYKTMYFSPYNEFTESMRKYSKIN